MDADQPTAEAIAIKNGEILFVGNRKTAENYKRFSTKGPQWNGASGVY